MKTISKEKARLICSYHYDGQFCPLYSFFSTGKIYFPLDHYIKVVEENIKTGKFLYERAKRLKELNSLRNFFLYAGHKHMAKNEYK
jgi:hypothetical protein